MSSPHDPIAIIGTGCRFPGQCNNPSKLWDLLRKPKDLLKVIPDNRFSTEAFYHPQNFHHGTANVRHSYLLEEDLRNFDAQFFGINSVEAHSVDPQQRLLLETVYESLESAGLSVKELQGSDTAVYVGVMSADFTDMIGRDTETFPTYFATGTARSILSNRLSYFFDWHGPSMTIDTACSSSLIGTYENTLYRTPKFFVSGKFEANTSAVSILISCLSCLTTWELLGVFYSCMYMALIAFEF